MCLIEFEQFIFELDLPFVVTREKDFDSSLKKLQEKLSCITEEELAYWMAALEDFIDLNKETNMLDQTYWYSPKEDTLVKMRTSLQKLDWDQESIGRLSGLLNRLESNDVAELSKN